MGFDESILDKVRVSHKSKRFDDFYSYYEPERDNKEEIRIDKNISLFIKFIFSSYDRDKWASFCHTIFLFNSSGIVFNYNFRFKKDRRIDEANLNIYQTRDIWMSGIHRKVACLDFDNGFKLLKPDEKTFVLKNIDIFGVDSIKVCSTSAPMIL